MSDAAPPRLRVRWRWNTRRQKRDLLCQPKAVECPRDRARQASSAVGDINIASNNKNTKRAPGRQVVCDECRVGGIGGIENEQAAGPAATKSRPLATVIPNAAPLPIENVPTGVGEDGVLTSKICTNPSPPTYK